jgi:hypothetical protein
VYVLSAGTIDLASMPARLGPIGFAEYHAPPADTLAPVVEVLSGSEVLAGRDVTLAARVVDDTPADSVRLFVRRTAGDWYHRYPMQAAGGYRYETTVPGDSLRAGPYEFVIVRYQHNAPTTFPGGVAQQPWDWNYNGAASWKLSVMPQAFPLTLFDPAADANRLAFTRIGDAGRRGLFSADFSPVTARPLFRLRLPAGEGGSTLADYTASLVVLDRIRSRGPAITEARAVRLRLRGLGPRQVLHLTLMEDDGTSWTRAVPMDSSWSEITVPLADFKVGRGVLLPQGFPGQWNYWVEAAAGRGGSGDRPKAGHIERVQLSLRPEADGSVPANYGVEVEWIQLTGDK